jgi:outer membrane protein assembly factor BamB
VGLPQTGTKLVRGGKIIWTYDIPFKDSTGAMGELGDATMRPNGNIVFCRKTGASEVTPGKKLIWNYEAQKGTEIHSVEPIGNDRILLIINGVPATAKLINIKTGNPENECILPTGKPGAHLQFRRVRMTDGGTLLAAHLDSNLVAEYDMKGNKIWSVRADRPWSASRLKNGNTLITSNRDSCYLFEVNKRGDTVWKFSQEDIPAVKLFQLQSAVRLENGNTIITNWCNNGIKNPADWPGSVQLLEVTPGKKLVWALSQWSDPDLGPASSIQLLDEPSVKKNKG